MDAGKSGDDRKRSFSLHSWLAIAIILLCFAIWCLSLFIPAFIDDILYLIVDARVGYDGWQSIMPYPQCGANFTVDIFLTLLPGRVLAWLAQLPVDSLLGLRALAIAIIGMWIAYTAWFLKSCVFPMQRLALILAGIMAFTCIGTLPIAMTSSRPEGAMFLAITLLTSLPFFVEKYPVPPSWIRLAVSSGLVLLISWLFSVHPKALFYIPLALVSSFSLRKWHKAMSWLLAGWTVLTCWQAIGYWQHRLSCHDAPKVREFWASEALAPSLLYAEPLLFLRECIHDLFLGVLAVRNVLFPVGSWLIPHPSDMTFPDFGMQIAASLCIIALIFHSLCWLAQAMAFMLKDALRTRRWGYPCLPVALCLAAAALAQWCIQSEPKFFNFSLIWVTFLLCGVITGMYLWNYTSYWRGKEQWLADRYAGVCAIAIVSLCTLLAICAPATPALLRSAAANGEIKMEYEWYLLNPLAYDKTRMHILEAAKICHIAPDQSSQRVGVDMVTYLPLKATYQPLRLIFHYHDFDRPEEFLPFLRKWQSSGVVTLCDSLPLALTPLFIRHGSVCCLSKEQIMAP